MDNATLASVAIEPLMPALTVDSTPTVFVVDDDEDVRESLVALIADADWRPEAFASAEEFLASPRHDCPGCLVLDVHLPKLNGLELQKRLASQMSLPIVFISGHGDIPMTVRAMKAGAVEFLTKPCSPEDLLSAMRAAIERSRSRLQEQARLQVLRDQYESLTPREKQVMRLVVQGMLNKQVGGELGISEVTVKAHRGQVMAKMTARSLPELVNIADLLGFPTAGKHQAAKESTTSTKGNTR